MRSITQSFVAFTELFQYIASLSAKRNRVWDVGTGTGQVAAGLSKYYNKVVATDISVQQLEHAQPIENVSYLNLPAELTEMDIRNHPEHFPIGQFDTIVSGTAAHFFDMQKFSLAAKMLLKKQTGIVAVFCTVFPLLGDEINDVFSLILRNMLKNIYNGPMHVLHSYATLDFPFLEFPAPRAPPQLMERYRSCCTSSKISTLLRIAIRQATMSHRLSSWRRHGPSTICWDGFSPIVSQWATTR